MAAAALNASAAAAVLAVRWHTHARIPDAHHRPAACCAAGFMPDCHFLSMHASGHVVQAVVCVVYGQHDLRAALLSQESWRHGYADRVCWDS